MAVEISDLPLPPDTARADEFQRMYDACRARLFRFCYSRLHDSHEAEDVTQEAFARAWRANLCFSDQQRSYAWLRVVAGNLCTDVHRRRSRCQTAAEIEPGPSFGTEDPVMRASDTDAVRQALHRLNDRHRAALVEREEVGYTYEQMASRAGTSVATVESLLWRARQALKRELLDLAGPEGLLSAVPLVGLALRRLRMARAKLASWEFQLGRFVTTPQFLGPASIVVGLCPAMCAVGLSGGGAAAASTPVAVASVPAASLTHAPSTTMAPTRPATPKSAAAPRSAIRPSGEQAVSETAPPTASGPAAPKNRVALQNPVSSTHADNQRDKSMPISVSIGPDSVGVDPNALASSTISAAQGALPGGSR
jgi:RNA polymerase sigma-70 factor (ECF subfamily)